MQGSVPMEDTVTSTDRGTTVTSETNSLSISEPRTHYVDNTDTRHPPVGAKAFGIELIVSEDADCDRKSINPVHGLADGPHTHDLMHARSRQNSPPDVMRLLPPIPDRESDSVLHPSSATAAVNVDLRATRSNSPLLVLDRGGGGPGLCFRASGSVKMLPLLLNTDAGLLQRSSHSLLSHGSHDGSSSSGLGQLSPRPPSPTFHQYTPKEKHLQRRSSAEQTATRPVGRLKTEFPLNDITDILPKSTLLRRRSCQSPNHLPFSERRRASEGVLNLPQSLHGHNSKTNGKLEPRVRTSEILPSGGRKEVGELMTTRPAIKSETNGQKTSRTKQRFTRLSRLNSASLEAVNRRDEDDEDIQERQRIIQWLEGVQRGSDESTEDQEVSEISPLRRSGTETAIRLIRNQRE